jgi:hypothetical protein
MECAHVISFFLTACCGTNEMFALKEAKTPAMIGDPALHLRR